LPHDPTHRPAHLVGSLPAPDAGAAMAQGLDALGARLGTLPDGETGERYHWIIHIVDALRDHPDLVLKRDGDWSDYDRVPVFAERPGRRLTGAALDLGHVAAFEASWPQFLAAREAAGDPDLAFQVGIPGDLDMALFVFGPVVALRRRRPFTDATLVEIEAIHARAGRDVVFQLELPVELVMVARAPATLQPVVARLLARGVAALAARAPDGARFGIHLCLGDMNHRALGRLRDTAPLVALANAIARAWPVGRPLEYVHAPFAGAEVPPPTAPRWYAPLDRLRLPAGTRFVAGFAHEDAALADQRFVLELIERSLGGTVGVATSCGLGRRTPEQAHRALARVAELADAG
jgi:hypothetical protein